MDHGAGSIIVPTKKKLAGSRKTAENDKVGDTLESPDPSFLEVEVCMVRKAMKVATMRLEEQGNDI